LNENTGGCSHKVVEAVHAFDGGALARYPDFTDAILETAAFLGVDPERIVLWGTSWSGGHVVYVAAADPRIAAVISQSPDVDGLATLTQIRRYAVFRTVG
jgi:cephalosporin-C deacetylase-like acetyl esterase